ncbi:hypothetical protein OEZ86_012866 [Tetradesmus obliquus]|nr:hypothetical protein OEZ86_012866 [Tetradesmus obliquus]
MNCRCSGPSDTLPYQSQLTPCCQAHDWCYSCAWKVGWTGTTGKSNCDYLFWDNLYRACEFNYGSWNPERTVCKTTADTMYVAVSSAGQSYFTTDTCPGDSFKLSNTNFCFNPIYTLNSVVSYISPDLRGAWGSWTNYAQCPLGSWMNGFSARVQPYQGLSKDDTALNAVQASCATRNGTQMATNLIPGGGGGNFGSWLGYSMCPAGRHIVAIAMQVEPSQGAWSDDTAANTFAGLCSDGTVLTHTTTNFGSWSAWKYCPTNTAVCAFKVKVEQAGAADCTSLNDVEVACCAKD